MSPKIFNSSSFNQYTAYLKTSGLSPASINRKLSSLTSFQKFLIKKNRLSPTPTPITPLAAAPIPKTNFFQKLSSPLFNYLVAASLLIIASGIGYTLYRQAVDQAKTNFAYTTASNPVYADRFLSFQGRLTDTSGNPINSTTSIRFDLFNSEAPGTGTNLYSSSVGNSQVVTPDDNGIFSVTIGKTHGLEIPNSVFTENPAVFLQITAGGEVMSPRQPIATVAYAINAESLQGLPPSASGLKDTVLVIDHQGNLNLGETSPTIKSTSGTLGIEGQAVLIKAADGSGGNITINPDANGTIKLITEGTGSTAINGFIDATNANLAAGNLYSATINNTNRTYNFLDFRNYDIGTTQLNSRFTVDAWGNTFVGGTLTTQNLAIGSTALVTNLNADYLDGFHASEFLQIGQTGSLPYVNDAYNSTLTRYGSGPYTLALNLGSTNTWLAPQTFQNLTIGGTFVSVGSTNLVTNLNANYLDGLSSTSFLQIGSTGYFNTAVNGLSPFGVGSTAVGLGGTLIQNTTISQNEFNLSLTGNVDIGGTLTLTQGASTGYILTSDASGNSYWAPNTGIGTTYAAGVGLTLSGYTFNLLYDPTLQINANNQLGLNLNNSNVWTAPQIFTAGIGVSGDSSFTNNLNVGGTLTAATFITTGDGLFTNLNVTNNASVGGTLTTQNLAIGSTALVTNLNADYLDGLHSSSFLQIGQTGSLPYVNNAYNSTLTRFGTGPYTLALNLGSTNTWLAPQTFNGGISASSLSVSGQTNLNTLQLSGAFSSVGSTAVVINLNADYLDGKDSNQFLQIGGTGYFNTAVNGLSPFGVGNTAVGLGGTLIQNTVIDQNNFNLGFINGNIGLGTTSPTQQLDMTGNINLTNTTFANQNGIVYTNGTRFLHNFNYGNNGTVTTNGQNIFLGENAGNFTMGSTATSAVQSSYNIGIGSSSLYSNTIGSSNTALGSLSLQSNTTGNNIVAIGSNSLQKNTTGNNNTAIGAYTLFSNTTGYYNTALGHQALFVSTTGYYNTALGVSSLSSNTTGSYNTTVGNLSLRFNTSGYYNLALGQNAGSYLANGSTGNTSPDKSIYIGVDTKSLVDDSQNEIVIGYNAIGNGSNSVTLGADTITKTILKGNVGIGTTSPTHKLDVIGDGSFSTNLNVGGTLSLPQGAQAGYVLTSDASGNSYWAVSSGGIASITATNGLQTIGTGTTIGLGGTLIQNTTIDQNNFNLGFINGNVGIGTTAPTKKLDIAGDINLTGTIFTNSTAGTNGQYLTSTGTGLLWQNLSISPADVTFNYAASNTQGGPALNLYYEDNRQISPSELAARQLKFGFTSYNNSSSSPYADFLHFRSYGDSSGGKDNLLVINKADLGMRLYQQDFGSTAPYSLYKDITLSDNGATVNYVPKYSSDGNNVSITNSSIYDNGNVGIGTTNPTQKLDIVGNAKVSNNLYLGNNGFYASYEYTTSASVPAAGWYRVAYINGGTGRGQQQVTVYTTGGSSTPRSTTFNWHHDWGSIAGITVNSDSAASTIWTSARVTDDGTNSFLEVYFTGAVPGLYIGLKSTGGHDMGSIYSGNLPTGGGNIRTTAQGDSVFAKNNDFTVAYTGNVGINTGSPTTKLEINNPGAAINSNAPGLSTNYGLHFSGQYTADYANGITWNGGGNNAQAGIYVQGSGAYGSKMYFGTTHSYANGVYTRMIIDAIGNVGIGIANPLYKLDVAGNARISSLAAGTTNNVITHSSGVLQTRTIDPRVWGTSLIDGSGTANYTARWLDASSLGTGVLYDNGTNVGIGTASPGYKLDVAGNARFTNMVTANDGFEVQTVNNISTRINSGWYQTSTATTANGWPQDTNGWYHLFSSTHSNQSNYYALQIAGSFYGNNNFYIRSTESNGLKPWKRIITDDGAGNVGIGTANPQATLHVAGNAIIDNWLTVNNVALDYSFNYDDTIYFAPQAYFEAESTSFPPNWIVNIDGFATVTNSTVPFSKVALSTSNDSMYSGYIPVRPGEKLYGEMWVMRQTGSTGTAGTVYYGIERYDKDKKPISSNNGTVYFAASGNTPPSNSVWTKYSGETVLPLTHTAYNGSDGGPVRYVRIRILMNYSAGSIPTYWGGVLLRRSELTRDFGDVVFNGNVGIGTPNPVTPLHVNNTTSTTLAGVSIPDLSGLFSGSIAAKKFYDSDNPQYFLDPAVSDINKSSLSLATIGSVTFNVNDTVVPNQYRTSAAASRIQSFSTGLGLEVGTSNAAGTAITWNSNQLFLAMDGDVGIGTASPEAKLQISQGMSEYSTSFTYPHLKLRTTNTIDNSGFVGITYDSSTTANYGWSVGALRSTGGNSSFIFKNHLNNEAGVEYMRINHLGNVGIGTASPDTRFVIANPSAFYKFTSSSTSTYTTTFNMNNVGLDIGHDSTSRSINFLTGNIDRMTITGGGYVGINNTSPPNRLSIDGGHADTVFRMHADNGTNTHAYLYLWASEPALTYPGVGISNNWRYSGSWGRENTAFGASYIRLYDNSMYFNTVDSAGTNTNAMTISNTNVSVAGRIDAINGGYISSGNQGGTGNAAWLPSGLYSAGPNWIYGSVSFNGTLSSTAGTWNITNAGDGTFKSLSVAAPAGSWLTGKTGTAGLNATNAQTASSYHPFIRQTTSSGHVVNLGGLGDYFGFFGYDAARTVNGYDYNMSMNLANGNVGIGVLAPAAKLEVAGTTSLISNASGNINVQAGGSGGVYLAPGAGAWAAWSDVRLKNITGTFTRALDDLMTLTPIRYTWKNDPTNAPQVGLIAQQVDAILPEAISTNEGYLGVKYTDIIPLLTAGIQELNQKLDGIAITDTGVITTSYPDLTSPTDLLIAKTEIESASYTLTNTLGKISTNVAQFAQFAAAKIKAGFVSAANIITTNLIADRILSRQIDTTQIISPLANIDNLTAQNIQTTQVETQNITTQNIQTDQITANSLASTNIQTTQVDTQRLVSQDIHTGNLSSDNINVSGELYADQIFSKEGSLSDIMAQKISSLRDELKSIVAANIAESTPSAILAQSDSWSTAIATDSAAITGSLSLTDNLIVGAQLMVNGDSQFGNALVTGRFVVGETIIKDNLIETSNTALFIQPSRTGSVHIMGDTLVIADNGQVTITGDLTVTGSLFANLLQAQEIATAKLTAQDIQSTSVTAQNLTSDNLRSDKLNIATDSSSLIIASDTNTTLPTTTASVTSNATAGTTTLPATATDLVISTNKLTANSMVYLTPVGSTNNQVLYIKNKIIEPDQLTSDNLRSYFTIALDQPLDHDININWWIIN